jgi:hypothetical protein
MAASTGYQPVQASGQDRPTTLLLRHLDPASRTGHVAGSEIVSLTPSDGILTREWSAALRRCPIPDAAHRPLRVEHGR